MLQDLATTVPPGLTPPYASLAEHYDASLGVDFFRRVRQLFEALQRRYHFTFRSAADGGCGTGLFAHYLASRWDVPVFAVDRSREMLLQAIRRCRGYSVQCFLQDIRELHLPRKTDLITANYDVINHILKPEHVRAALFRIHQNLNPGGWFYFDAMCPCQWMPENRWTVWKRSTSRGEMEQRIFWDQPAELMFVQVLSRRPGRPGRDLETHVERLYKPEEMKNWLREAGFNWIVAHNETTGQVSAGCSPRTLFLARKER